MHSKSNVREWYWLRKNKFDFFKKNILKNLKDHNKKKNLNILQFSQKPNSFGIC
jgi:hypothetical protein